VGANPAGATESAAVVDPQPGAGGPSVTRTGSAQPEDERGGLGFADRGARAGDRHSFALAAARQRTRSSWRRYSAGMAVFLVALLVFVLSVWRTSEIRNVHSHPTAEAGKNLASGTLPSSLHSGWHTTNRMALGQPVYLDVVATYSTHTVVGRDATTGVVRWSYTRADRSICSVVGDGSVVMAIYRHDGNCDELSALDADTGRRAWTRTQFDNGTPTVQVISQFVLQVTPGALDLIQPGGGATYWYYPQVNDCKTISGVVGTTGVLWGSRCGSNSTLTLRVGAGDKNKNNAWSVPLDGRTPLAADGQILALSADGRAIQVLAAKDGAISSTILLASAVTAPTVPFATPSISGAAELITVSGQIIAVSTNAPATVLWQRATNGRAANTSAGLLFPSAGQVSIVNGRTGAVERTVTVPGLTADATVAMRGLGLVSSSGAGATAWG
jgi:outer membrane protein assembly factor BamB